MTDNKRKFYFKKNQDGSLNKTKKNKSTHSNKEELKLEMVSCPLCSNNNFDDTNTPNSNKIKIFSKRLNKLYYNCEECGLVYMHPHYYVEDLKEKTRYEFHKNSPVDEKYKSFLKPCVDKLKSIIDKKIQDNQIKKEELIGLDFGCGPGPTLSIMFKEICDYNLENYDPYFMKHQLVEKAEKYLLLENQETKIEKPFNFITCTEAIEHFKKPIIDLTKIIDGGLISKEGGLLLIMTQMLINDEMFENWHYPRDYTHICFFRPSTFTWIANKFNSKILEIDETKGIVIFEFNDDKK